MNSNPLKLLILPLAGALLAGCHRDIPLVECGLAESYRVERMQKLMLSTPLAGERSWRVTAPDGTTSLISTSSSAIFVAPEAGEYLLTLTILSGGETSAWESRVTVVNESVAYSPYISRVLEYRPAPGQFINMMPIYEEGDDAEDMRLKAELSIGGEMDELISLGAFGGYVTFCFDHSVVNRPGKPDFRIWGNAFYEEGETSDTSGSAEPGIVMVALDRNANGVPDEDEWYELRGSEYSNPLTLHGYSITYYPPVAGKAPVPVRPYITDAEYIRWTDSEGATGYVARNNQHRQEYYPQWLPESETISFANLSRLPQNALDVYGNGLYFRFSIFPWGYADNQPNENADGNSFDIDNAVDRFGQPVALPAIDFVRVYTGITQYCGRLGETSTEISRAADLSLSE